jgi:bifunctional DNA-binding transcriptional regulator/antitoxin component of YhaV-PrlF toxin-antitoxin module
MSEECTISKKGN